MAKSLQVQVLQSADLMARIVDATDTPLQPSDVSSISYTVYLVDSTTEVESPVNGYSSLTISATTCIYTALQHTGWDEDATGYNFKHTVAASALAITDTTYHVVYLFLIQGQTTTADFYLLTYADEGDDIDSTWGGEAAESYISWEDANAFISRKVLENDKWLTATIAQQKAALLQAALEIDSLTYAGDRYFYTQALMFPRGMCGPFPGKNYLANSTDVDRQYVAIRKAQCYQAAAILENLGSGEFAELIAAGVTKARRETGPIKEEYALDPAARSRSGQLCSEAQRLLSPWMGSRRILRG